MTVPQCGVYARFGLKTDAPDEQLVAAARLGCDESITVLLARYLPLITRKAVACGHSFLDEDDFIQEGLIALLRAIRFYQTDKSTAFVTFAVTCINNSIRSALRSGELLKHMPLRGYVSLDEYLEGGGVASPSNAHNGYSPETLVIKKEEYALINQTIRSLLSGLEREILMLYLKGLTYEQMATRLGVTNKSVDNALQRARKKLGAVLR